MHPSEVEAGLSGSRGGPGACIWAWRQSSLLLPLFGECTKWRLV